jgi:predicted nucleotidyltransferase
MLADLSTLAAELGTTDRTLRRSVVQGLLHAERPSPRKVEIPVKEREFLRRSWPLLSQLRQAFRTEPTVSFAALFGSAARGEMHSGSDVDVLVALRDGGDVRTLAARLSQRVGLHVQLVLLEDAERAPLLLAEAVREGRVLVDREQRWRRLRQQRSKIERAAALERGRVDREFSELFAA